MHHWKGSSCSVLLDQRRRVVPTQIRIADLTRWTVILLCPCEYVNAGSGSVRGARVHPPETCRMYHTLPDNLRRLQIIGCIWFRRNTTGGGTARLSAVPLSEFWQTSQNANRFDDAAALFHPGSYPCLGASALAVSEDTVEGCGWSSQEQVRRSARAPKARTRTAARKIRPAYSRIKHQQFCDAMYSHVAHL